MIFQLIHTCALHVNVGPREIDDFAKKSLKWNRTLGLTGITLWKDGSILQVLEGETEIVKKIFRNISEDPRVIKPLILIKRTSTRREFPSWSIGYNNAHPDATSFNLTANSFPDALPDNVSPEISTIGRTFARVNGLI